MNRFVASFLLFAPVVWAQSVAGLWDATMSYNGTEIPFKLELSGDGKNVKGWFFNGEDREISNSGTLENGSLVLNFDSYAATLKATLRNGVLQGEYGPILKNMVPVRAVRALPASEHSKAQPPSIAGQWILEGVTSSKSEKAWRLIVRQSGDQVSAAILRIDGDTGTLTGAYKENQFVLSHFSGARAALLILKPAADGTLDVSLSGLRGLSHMKGWRAEQAKAKGLPEPADPDQHTTIRDPKEPFVFRFPDLEGHIVANTDPRFRGKVLLINVTGSWCPNCHDEAPFLAALYDKYHDQGLEVVALSFEESDQLKNPVRLRALMREYGTKYTVLLAGETESAKEKLPQMVDWDAWPTTFFVGRDGLVRGAHAGFPSPGSGIVYQQQTADFVAKVEKLLAENRPPAK